jgi:hypothetical protein
MRKQDGKRTQGSELVAVKKKKKVIPKANLEEFSGAESCNNHRGCEIS